MNYLYLFIGMIAWTVIAGYVGLNLAKFMKEENE